MRRTVSDLLIHGLNVHFIYGEVDFCAKYPNAYDFILSPTIQSINLDL